MSNTSAKEKAGASCANCAYGGPPTRHWNIIIIRCELDGAGKKHDFVCEDWTSRRLPEWVGLTAMEIEEIGKAYQEKDRSIRAWGLFACAVEEKLKEKNT